jgi:hypothetical protein
MIIYLATSGPLQANALQILTGWQNIVEGAAKNVVSVFKTIKTQKADFVNAICHTILYKLKIHAVTALCAW